MILVCFRYEIGMFLVWGIVPQDGHTPGEATPPRPLSGRKTTGQDSRSPQALRSVAGGRSAGRIGPGPVREIFPPDMCPGRRTKFRSFPHNNTPLSANLIHFGISEILDSDR